MKIFTIGFTKSTASGFFERLQTAGVQRVSDTRLNRVSQLSGFAKQEDLRYFLRRIASITYAADLFLAPSADMLEAYRKKELPWKEYSRRYLDLLSDRKVETLVDARSLNNTCFLCSEHKADYCHRRLAAEYIASHFSCVEITHL